MENYIDRELVIPSIYACGLVNLDWSSFDLDGDSEEVAAEVHAAIDKELGTAFWHCVGVGEDYTPEHVDIGSADYEPERDIIAGDLAGSEGYDDGLEPQSVCVCSFQVAEDQD